MESNLLILVNLKPEASHSFSQLNILQVFSTGESFFLYFLITMVQ